VKLRSNLPKYIIGTPTTNRKVKYGILKSINTYELCILSYKKSSDQKLFIQEMRHPSKMILMIRN
jgi:hypothetical protein